MGQAKRGMEKIIAPYSLPKTQIQNTRTGRHGLRVPGLPGWGWVDHRYLRNVFQPYPWDLPRWTDGLITMIPRSWTAVAEAFLGCWYSDLSCTQGVLQFLLAYPGVGTHHFGMHPTCD